METEASRLAPLTRCGLLSLRLRAIRRGIWFRILNKIERSLIDLVLITVRQIRSSLLARSLMIIVKKLVNSMDSRIQQQIRTVGLSLAQKLSQIAQNWGNRSAAHWAQDAGFMRFLAITQINKPA